MFLENPLILQVSLPPGDLDPARGLLYFLTACPYRYYLLWAYYVSSSVFGAVLISLNAHDNPRTNSTIAIL